MDRNDIDRLDEILASLQSLANRVEILEAELAALKGKPEEKPSDEPIDLSLEDLPAEVFEPEDVEVIEEPEITVAIEEPEIIQEPETIGKMEEAPQTEGKETEKTEEVAEVIDDMDSPFAGLLEDPNPVVEVKKKTRGKSPKRQAENQDHAAVIDVLTDKYGWKTDLPGQEVKDVRSAISLNDRVMFITSLFREDAALYSDTLTKLNAMKTLDEAVEYVGGCFPEWKMDSDIVYRFMMAVRRKIRN